MAASPEDFVAEPAEPPFSPSIFLDLPPTPCPDGNGEGKDPASDDLGLPFIERMLMEEGIHEEFFYQYPDHPALLQAQESYARVLSDATADSTSYGSPTVSVSSSGSDDLTTDASTGSEQSPAQAQLRDGGARSDAAAAEEEMEEKANSTMLAAVDDDHAALASAFFSAQQDAGSNAMLNLAFLKGMEEANKFLPRDIDLLRGSATVLQVKEEAEEEGTANLGRGRKNLHNWDDVLEANLGRERKMMAPEPEESGEVVDEMIANGFQLFLREVESLRISMGSEAEKKKSRKGNARSANGVADLCALLMHCAQAVAMDDRCSAAELLRKIKKHSSPRGDAAQRLARYFAEGLEARLAGSGSPVYNSLMAKRTSVVDFLKAYRLYAAACCFRMMAFKFANLTISKAIAGRKKVHIVDYGIHYGSQWPGLLKILTLWPGGPPEVRITGIDLPQPGFRPAARVKETGRRLSSYASQFGVPFKYRGIAAKWETVGVDDLDIDPDEVLIVNSILHFGNLMDEGVDMSSPSPRDVVLSNIRKMRPDVFILFIMNGTYSSPYFVPRFREALFHYSAMFDMMDATTPRDSDLRVLVERDLFGQCAQNVIACEGLDRVERPETYKKWQLRNHRAGLRQLSLDPDIVKAVQESVRDKFHEDFVTDVDLQWLLGGWKGRILYAMSTWAAADAI
ncbi:scarecrow-like protein 34 [Sorghum bicolor]|uniref:scarecrow-like protein 34 n=1 Tax=Sorghum bicolor TaxID=4558 RepID=UPI0003C6B69F|nr:scarecrow-like protein 34 [Sorghum bicolor]XP_021316531.1 scarecrow-like protein 34 [Sorghum bicolor]|eukprot:XP_021316530.1 scarecrow-like protein 34 [Sorghum bicolor]